MRTALKSALLLTAAVLIGSCSTPAQEPDITVTMLDNTFDAPVYQVPVGATVEFLNQGRNPHNAFDVEGGWATQDVTGNALLLTEESAHLTFDEEGVFEFYCTIHATTLADGSRGGMVATLVVGEGVALGETEQIASNAPVTWTGETRDVPAEYPTIQSGVDAADPGDLVLVQPGTYREAVEVITPGITIRGTDRNEVILDGEFTRENGILVSADGVAIENMTARNFTVNGFFWTGVTGYRGSYLTAVDDWAYGIYAFDSRDGLLEHSYASGSWDSGFYIGQCRPCDAVITDSVSEHNGLGYSGTNSSENIWIVNSEWAHNVTGIAPNSLDSELLPPVGRVVVAGNYIHDNGNADAPHSRWQWASYGAGAILAGAQDSVVRNNLFVNNKSSGVVIVSMIDVNLWPSGDNQVYDNVSMGSGRSDYALGGPAESGTCFRDNAGETTTPSFLNLLHNCDGININSPWSLAVGSSNLGYQIEANRGGDPQIEHGDAPKPSGPLPTMPGGADAPVRPAVDVFSSSGFDPAAITTPELPAGLEIDERQPVFMGIVLNAGFWPVLMGVLLSMIPTLAWVIGSLLALWRIWRDRDRSLVAKLIWSLVVIVLPLIGAIIYFAAGDRTERRLRRASLVTSGFLVWLVATVGALVVGGLV